MQCACPDHRAMNSASRRITQQQNLQIYACPGGRLWAGSDPEDTVWGKLTAAGICRNTDWNCTMNYFLSHGQAGRQGEGRKEEVL